MNQQMQCAKCKTRVCTVDEEGKRNSGEAPEWCPMKTKAEVIKSAIDELTEEDIAIARAAAATESEAYIREPWGLRPYHTRILEIINFAKKMNYKKIGIACCFSCVWEARIIANMFINRGFEALVRLCKGFQVQNTKFLGLKDEETLVPGGFQPMCNPIAQVDTLTDSDCDLVVSFGECTGHDALAGRYCSVPFTLLGVKDRVLAHNPVVALTMPWNRYYKKLMRDTPLDVQYVKGHYRPR